MIATEISPRPKSVSRNAWQADNEDALELRGADEPNSFETSTNIASDCFSIAKKTRAAAQPRLEHPFRVPSVTALLKAPQRRAEFHSRQKRRAGERAGW